MWAGLRQVNGIRRPFIGRSSAAPDCGAVHWYEPEVRALEIRLRPTPPGLLCFYGSSSLRQWSSLERRFPGSVNAAFGGSTLQACAWFLDRIVVPLRPRHLVVYAGDNDLGDGADRAGMRRRVEDLLRTIDHFLPGLPLTWLTVKPSPARWSLEERMREHNADLYGMLVRRGRARLVDVHEAMLGDDGRPLAALYAADGLHLSPAGYAVWHAALRAQSHWLRGSGT